MLLKPRVMSLVIFTGFVGLYLAPGTIHPFLGFTTLLCIAVGAGASGALNMWYEHKTDALMERTKARPIPSGRIDPDEALSFGAFLAAGAIFVLGLTVNWTAAGLLAATICFYIFVYTHFLKHSTPQNIVIGGAAGAFPPVIGWAAIATPMAWEPFFLFLIIFLWTPPHFWSLALLCKEDYKKAGIPMMPNTHGEAATKKQIFVYTWLLVAGSLLPLLTSAQGLLYGIGASVLGFGFILYAWKLLRATEKKAAKTLFLYSIAYLFILFGLMVVDRFLG